MPGVGADAVRATAWHGVACVEAAPPGPHSRAADVSSRPCAARRLLRCIVGRARRWGWAIARLSRQAHAQPLAASSRAPRPRPSPNSFNCV